MKFIILIALIIFLAKTCIGYISHTGVIHDEKCVTDAYPPHKGQVPKYTVNLDLPPEQRWDHIIKAKQRNLHLLIDHVEDMLIDLFGMKVFTLINGSLPELTGTFPSPYKEEIYGIANSGNLTISQVTLYNIFYEVFSMCTSIIIEDPNGAIIHGRNLDFGLLMGWDTKNHTWIVSELLQPLVMDVLFIKNGKPIYTSATYAGFVGILTGVKAEKFSFSLNERFALNGGYVGILEWILFNNHNQSWVSFLTRDVMEKANSWEEALNTLSTTALLAPAYFILAGTSIRQGIIITRDRNNYNYLPLGSKADGQGSWFLVETNYDQWKTPPFFDDRRTPAIFCLQHAGKGNASAKLLYNVLSTKPVLNKLTTYTTIMSPGTGLLSSWLRSCPDPCWPW